MDKTYNKEDIYSRGDPEQLNTSLSLGEVWDKMFTKQTEVRCIHGLYHDEVARLLGPCIKLRFMSLDQECLALPPLGLQSLIENEELKQIASGDTSSIVNIRNRISTVLDKCVVDAIVDMLVDLANKNEKSSWWNECILFNALITNNGELLDINRHAIVIYRLNASDLKVLFGESFIESDITSADDIVMSGICSHNLIPKRRVGKNILGQSNDDLRQPVVFSTYSSTLNEDAINLIMNNGLIDIKSFVHLANQTALSKGEGVYYAGQNVNRLNRAETLQSLGDLDYDLQKHIEAVESNISNLDASDLDATGDKYNSIQGLDL